MLYQLNVVGALSFLCGNSEDIHELRLCFNIGFDVSARRRKARMSVEEATTLIEQTKDSTDRDDALAILRATKEALQNLSDVDRPATCEDDWSTIPMPARRKRIDLGIRYDGTAMARIRKGFLPGEMEDHWFAWFEDPFLYLHRSWTGFCIYQVDFIREGDAWVARYALVNQDPTQWECADDKEQVQAISRGIDELLVKRFDRPPAEPMSVAHPGETGA